MIKLRALLLVISAANRIFINFKLVLKVSVGGCRVCLFVSERVSEPALYFYVGNVIRYGIRRNWNEITRK